MTRNENCGLYSLLEECVKILVGIGTREERGILRACSRNHHNILFASKDLEACFGRRTHHHPHHLTHQFAPPNWKTTSPLLIYLKLQCLSCPFASSNIFTLSITLHHGCFSISCQWMIQFSAPICWCACVMRTPSHGSLGGVRFASR